jgi:hypothetical protein
VGITEQTSTPRFTYPERPPSCCAAASSIIYLKEQSRGTHPTNEVRQEATRSKQESNRGKRDSIERNRGTGEETGNNFRNQSRGRRERGAVLRQRNAERRPTGPEESAGWRGAHLGAFYSRGGGGGVAWRQRNPYRTRRRAGVGAGLGKGVTGLVRWFGAGGRLAGGQRVRGIFWVARDSLAAADC